ncbi:hypothetical protein IE53DRAFT_163301 [Violaceomyces palustris]|uniref:Uncharacterized protein n=1 Tax=Violaceomyces palustris TaxID=1673888 RepID=A0ACD0NTF6_9BASI|nr:hypothetical protein IE53DRAFT_163301 [Violaceomyces palustris]
MFTQSTPPLAPFSPLFADLNISLCHSRALSLSPTNYDDNGQTIGVITFQGPKVKCKATSDDTSGKFGSSADDKAFETVYCATGCDFVSRGHRGTTCRARKVEKGIKNVTTTAATAGFGERGVEDEEHRLSLRGDVDQLVIKRDKTYEVEEAFFFLCCFDRNGRDRSWEAAKSAFFELRTCSAVP